MSPAKEKMLQIIREQPDDAGYDDLLCELAARREVRRGYIESRTNRRGEPLTSRRVVRLWT